MYMEILFGSRNIRFTDLTQNVFFLFFSENNLYYTRAKYTHTHNIYNHITFPLVILYTVCAHPFVITYVYSLDYPSIHIQLLFMGNIEGKNEKKNK